MTASESCAKAGGGGGEYQGERKRWRLSTQHKRGNRRGGDGPRRGAIFKFRAGHTNRTRRTQPTEGAKRIGALSTKREATLQQLP